MNRIDALLTEHPPEPESAVSLVAPVRRCRRHLWELWHEVDGDGDGHRCARCGVWRDDTRSRRGKSARRRGNDYERDVAARLGGVKVGHHGGPADVVTPLLAVQVKVRGAYPSWMQAELDKLPRTGGRIPTLVVADSPAPGHRRRALVVMALDDFAELHGAR